MCVFIVNQCTVVSNIYLNLNDAKKINNTNMNLHQLTYLAYNGLKGLNMYVLQFMVISYSDFIEM